MSVPTCRALCYRGADCLRGVRTYLPCTVLHWCRLFKQCLNLLAGHCVTVVQTFYGMWEPTCRARCYSCNLPNGHCVTLVQTVLAMSVPTCGALCTVVRTVLAMSIPTYRALCYSGAGCLSGVRNYLPGTVLQGCRLFKRCPKLPTGHCVTVLQTV